MEENPLKIISIPQETVFKLKEHESFSSDICAFLESQHIGFKVTSYEDAPVYLGISPEFEASYFIGAEWLTEDKAVVITPKIENVDFLKMFESALRFPEAASYFPKFYGINFNSPRIESETMDNILTPLLMVHYLNVVYAIVAKGLKRGYVSKEENLSAKIKGKVMISRHLSKNIATRRTDKVFCAYQEYSEDIPENRLLKRALLYVERCFKTWSAIRNHKLFASLSTKLSEELSFFREVSPDVDLASVRFVQRNKLFGDYGTAIRLAKMILRRFDYSIVNTSPDKHLVPPFWIDMSRLFEVYVYSLLEDAYPGQIGFQVNGSFNTKADFIKIDEQLILDAKYKPYYADDNKDMLADIREMSGYARDEAILSKIGMKFSDSVPFCVILHPAYDDSDSNSPFTSKILQIATQIKNYRHFYKLKVPLPRKG